MELTAKRVRPKEYETKRVTKETDTISNSNKVKLSSNLDIDNNELCLHVMEQTNNLLPSCSNRAISCPRSRMDHLLEQQQEQRQERRTDLPGERNAELPGED